MKKLLGLLLFGLLFMNSVHAASNVSICSILYVWYGFNTTSNTWTGGLGTSHWNNTIGTLVEDKPYNGFYASINEIPTQLQQMQSAGLNCVVVDWWGWGTNLTTTSFEFNSFNNAVNTVFEDAPTYNLKVAILVDAFNSTPLTSANYNALYGYIEKTYYTPYSGELLNFNGLPLLMWFNPLVPPVNSLFTSRTTGNNVNKVTTDWWLWTANASFWDSFGGTISSISTSDEGPVVSPDGYVAIAPRYDDYYLYLAGERTGYQRVDYNYSKGMYANSWGYVVNQSKKFNNVKMVLIYSWNEYHERSEIEPHYDASNSSFIATNLLTETKYYATQLTSNIIVPQNVVEYIPITLFNYEGSNVVANTVLSVGAANNLQGNVIGLDAVAYERYETCNLNNIEFFLPNSTILKSWLEGNIMNEQTANALCTSSSSPNALASASNILFNVGYPWSPSFLPQDTGTATSNTIYMGFAGNQITSQNTLLNGNMVGEAPQLSCQNPYNTILCNYGEYDNGNNIFTLSYDDFKGTTLNTNIWNTPGNYVIDNGIYIWSNTPTVSSSLTYKSVPTAENTLITYLFNIFSSTGTDIRARSGECPSGCSLSDMGFFSNALATPFYFFNGLSSVSVPVPASNTIFNLLDQQFFQSNDLFTYHSYSYPFYGNYIYSNTATFTGTTIGNTRGYSATIDSGHTGLSEINLQWTRVQVMPPNTIFPATVFGAVASACTAYLSYPSNLLVDSGQNITFIASTSGCVSPLSYNFLVYNSVTASLTHNALYPAVASASNSFAFEVTTADLSNSIQKGKVIVTDSAGTVANSTLTANFMVNNALLASAPTPTGQTINSGQSIVLTSHASGGTLGTGYFYQWYTGSSCNTVISGANALSYTASPTSNTPYSYLVTDWASNPDSVCSASTTVDVNQVSGSGGGSSQYTVTLSDNLKSSIGFNSPVINAYTVSGSNVVAQSTYLQNELPQELNLSSGEHLVFNFACSISSGSVMYAYNGDVSGIGFVPCNENYTVFGGTYEIFYTNSSIESNSTSTTATSTATTTTGTGPTTQINSSVNSTVTSTPSSTAETTISQKTNSSTGKQQNEVSPNLFTTLGKDAVPIIALAAIAAIAIYLLLRRKSQRNSAAQ